MYEIKLCSKLQAQNLRRITTKKVKIYVRIKNLA